MPETPERISCLLVDDLDENLLVLSALLEPLQVEILTARSGAEALDVLLSHDVALVLLDVHMPEMDGFELAEIMRGAERTRHIPLIFVTAAGREAQRSFKGYDLGAVDFLYKPIDAHVLLSKARVFFELHRQKLLLAQQLRDRTETLRLNETFAAMLGHDLRSPLDFILTASHLLDRVADDPEAVRRTARQMRTSGMRMGRMIADMLDLARGRLGGGIPIQPQPIDLAVLVQRVAVECQATQPQTPIVVEAAGALTCDGDPERLAQVVSNLLGNALQHGVSGQPISVRLDGTAPALVVMTVTNDGEISAEALPRLFEAFARGPGRSHEDGLGLGLYIAQQIAQAHGGAVTARSEAGATAIQVTLPRSVVTTRQPEGARS
ncbi:MAG: hybrid sensor histidine kinase/response regulator [Vicinamibacteraceae bacterium]